jgi:hypothetical protein
MSKKAARAQMGLFLAFIALFFVLYIIIPDKEFSERENRYLQTQPAFSLETLFSGRFPSDFETYTADQFPFRDSWTTLKARSELWAGKRENNGVYLCEGDTLIEGFSAPEQAVLDNDLAALSKLSENTGVPVYFALIPGSSEIWSGRLPANAPNDSEKDVIDYAYTHIGVSTVDMLDALSAHKDEAIYYRTDHHWTSLGAYYGYAALMDALGKSASPLSDYAPRTVSESFYGTTYSSSGFSWVAPDSMQVYVEEPAGLTVTNYPRGEAEEGSLYHESFLDKKDKYAYFLGGNTPLVRITTEAGDAPSLLIVRDSYADSLVPFLIRDFSEIHILDLRYYRTSLADYMAENDIDMALVCYSVSNFCTDSNI